MGTRLSGRTRQVLDVIYRLGEASTEDVLREVPDLPSYSAARSTLRSLEQRGLVRHREEGLRYVYLPTVSKRQASRKALADVIQTYFDDSPLSAMKALVELSGAHEDIDPDEFARLIDQARKEGR